jgi:hypothetical protein
MLTSAFAESTRPPRPGAAAYPGRDGRRLLAVDLESSGGADGPSKAQVGASQRRSGPHARIVAKAIAGYTSIGSTKGIVRSGRRLCVSARAPS